MPGRDKEKSDSQKKDIQTNKVFLYFMTHAK